MSTALTPRPGIRLVVFDFDGTLSWLRHGWPGMMCAAFEEYSRRFVREELFGEILARNGQPSIRQCERLVELLREHVEVAPEPETLRAEFQERLDAAIARRVARLRSGEARPVDFIIHGAEAFLKHALTKGLTLAVLSSTVQERVREEAELLGLQRFFGRHIYGGVGDPLKFSKRAVFERLLAEEGCRGEELLAVGDGPVELREAKSLGGVAIGVCSDEERNGSGEFDEHKRAGLQAAGADALVADYRDAAALLDQLLAR